MVNEDPVARLMSEVPFSHWYVRTLPVTVAMHEVKFIAPVFVGDLVSFYVETLKIGNTSITVRVTVDARRGSVPHETVRVTQAEVVYVAVNEQGKSVPVS